MMSCADDPKTQRIRAVILQAVEELVTSLPGPLRALAPMATEMARAQVESASPSTLTAYLEFARDKITALLEGREIDSLSPHGPLIEAERESGSDWWDPITDGWTDREPTAEDAGNLLAVMQNSVERETVARAIASGHVVHARLEAQLAAVDA